MKQHSGNVGTNYHYLFLKEYISQIKNNQTQLKDLIRKNVPEEIVLQISHYPLENQKGILNHLFSILSKESWAKKIMEEMTGKLIEKAKDLYEFQTQQNYFLVQNFRQTCSEPIVQGEPLNCYNLISLFKVNINKQLRRTIWSKCLWIQSNKMQYFKFDHKVTPYNLTPQFSIGLVRLSLQNKMKIKQNQKDCCLRFLEYVVKKWNRIPNKSQQYLALNVVDVYAHFTPSRIQEIGAVFVGLTQLAQFYFEPNVEKRLQYLHLAFQLVDPQTYKIIQTCYLPYSQANNSQLNECFQHFRMTLSSAFFPLAASQFVIDQILIKKKNKLDIYIIFALLTMIMSDDLQKYKQAKMQLTDVINAENTKKIIKLQDVTDAFRVIYQNIHPFHYRLSEGPDTNKLLDNLIKFDQQLESKRLFKEEQKQSNGSAPTSLKVIQPMDKMAGFIVQEKGEVLRLGELTANNKKR